jgi:hypothetical protein
MVCHPHELMRKCSQGVADKQPMTHGGRTIILAQLFLAAILQAIFTGNLNNILLRQPFQTQVDTFQDYTNPGAPKFNSRNTICYPVSDLVAKNYLDLEAGLHQDIAVNIITAPVCFYSLLGLRALMGRARTPPTAVAPCQVCWFASGQ